MNDGLLEVVAIDNLDLAILHAGGSGASVCQCRTAVIRTKKPVPMQVDGEPSLMQPCTIQIGIDPIAAREAKMLARNKNATCKYLGSDQEKSKLLANAYSHSVEANVWSFGVIYFQVDLPKKMIKE